MNVLKFVLFLSLTFAVNSFNILPESLNETTKLNESQENNIIFNFVNETFKVGEKYEIKEEKEFSGTKMPPDININTIAVADKTNHVSLEQLTEEINIVPDNTTKIVEKTQTQDNLDVNNVLVLDKTSVLPEHKQGQNILLQIEGHRKMVSDSSIKPIIPEHKKEKDNQVTRTMFDFKLAKTEEKVDSPLNDTEKEMYSEFSVNENVTKTENKKKLENHIDNTFPNLNRSMMVSEEKPKDAPKEIDSDSKMVSEFNKTIDATDKRQDNQIKSNISDLVTLLRIALEVTQKQERLEKFGSNPKKKIIPVLNGSIDALDIKQKQEHKFKTMSSDHISTEPKEKQKEKSSKDNVDKFSNSNKDQAKQESENQTKINFSDSSMTVSDETPLIKEKCLNDSNIKMFTSLNKSIYLPEENEKHIEHVFSDEIILTNLHRNTIYERNQKQLNRVRKMISNLGGAKNLFEPSEKQIREILEQNNPDSKMSSELENTTVTTVVFSDASEEKKKPDSIEDVDIVTDTITELEKSTIASKEKQDSLEKIYTVRDTFDSDKSTLAPKKKHVQESAEKINSVTDSLHKIHKSTTESHENYTQESLEKIDPFKDTISEFKKSEMDNKETHEQENIEHKMFLEFIQKFNKIYKNIKEYENRFLTFKENLGLVIKMNKQVTSAVFGVTQFMDVPQNETLIHINCLRVSHTNKKLNNSTKGKTRQDIPAEWDWRKKNVVTEPADQGSCRSCWAFASNSVIESQYAIKHELEALSVQQILDCSDWKSNCLEGNPEEAITRQAGLLGGIVAENKYRAYKEEKGKCWANKKNVVALVSGAKVLNIQDEEALKQHIYEHGPVVAGIKATFPFLLYKNGIVNSKDLNCLDSMHINYAVAIVGYGADDGQSYWIIKNSVGTEWGDNGYMYLHRGSNACNISDYIVEAIVK